MGAVVCGGWKGHSHAWEVVGIVASWGIVVGAEAACSSILVSRLVRSSLYQSHKHTIQNNHYDSLDEHLPLISEVNQIYCLAVSMNNDDQSVKVIV